MTTAREIMPVSTECVGENAAQASARAMAELHVGALPICGADTKLAGRHGRSGRRRSRSARFKWAVSFKALPTG
jgi:hypothetical protein